MYKFQIDNLVIYHFNGYNHIFQIKGLDEESKSLSLKSLTFHQEGYLKVSSQGILPIHISDKLLEKWFNKTPRDVYLSESNRISPFKILIQKEPRISVEIYIDRSFKLANSKYAVQVRFENTDQTLDNSTFNTRLRNAFLVLTNNSGLLKYKKKDLIINLQIQYYHEFQNICAFFGTEASDFFNISQIETAEYYLVAKKNENEINEERTYKLNNQKVHSVIQSSENLSDIIIGEFAFIAQMIHLNYTFQLNEIDKLSHYLNFNWLSGNPNIDWDLESVERYRSRINWLNFGARSKFNWKDILDKIDINGSEKIDFLWGLTRNSNLHFDLNDILKITNNTDRAILNNLFWHSNIINLSDVINYFIDTGKPGELAYLVANEKIDYATFKTLPKIDWEIVSESSHLVVDKLFFSENADKLKEDLLKNNPYYKEVNNLFPKNDYSYSFAIDLINSRKQEWTEISFLDALKKAK